MVTRRKRLTASSPVGPLYSIRKVETLLKRPRELIRRIADDPSVYYRPFDRCPFEKNKWRHIDNPRGELRGLQERLQARILRHVVLPDRVMGGVRGRSLPENAAPHVGQPVVVTLDLERCFDNIKEDQVREAYRKHLKCSDAVADLLTALSVNRGCLPQGAPTSNMLANLCLLELLEEVAAIAAELELQWTMWVDDLALSGERAEEAVARVEKIAAQLGHPIATSKTKVMRAKQQQLVTGLIVNTAVSVPREYRKDIRMTILRLAQQEPVPLHEIRRIAGQIAFVRSIDEAQGAALAALASERIPESKQVVETAIPKTHEQTPCKGAGACKAGTGIPTA